jgi:DNA-binding CsgD family transcriptional regulator
MVTHRLHKSDGTEAHGVLHVTASEWQALLATARGDLSDQEREIARLLAEGKTQVAIAGQLGIHRSAVWRRVKAMSMKLRKLSL